MKRLDIVTVLFNGAPESPGIVSEVDFVTEGETQPSLTVVAVLPAGGAHLFKSLPHVSGIESAYQWREYNTADFSDAAQLGSDLGSSSGQPLGNPGGHSDQQPA
jgi:hypothetical protein